jgi:uncharacterized protein YlxW (UPF0749 family)
MSTATLERLPNTVTACHAMIRDLQADAGDSDLMAERDELKEKLKSAEEENRSLQAEVDDLEKRIEDNPDSREEINAFLDECIYVAPLQYDVPQTPRAQRAIVALHVAVGRNP